ncbi:MAG: hypothetical protein V7K76_23065 [Nostoc sp.]|uniref:hypothetical protein n=1 Tax=Nostoc sp. TaxID=1180 RepID=UPI002FF51123
MRIQKIDFKWSNSCDEKHIHAGEKINHAERNQNHPEVEQIHADLETFQKNGQKSEDLQGFQNPNNVANNSLTTYQQPTKVVGRVVGSDAQSENSRGEETAHAPLGGASPQSIESASELEDSPMATDCTTLALVDEPEGQPTSLSTENQVSGVEVKDCHEGTSSAAPAVLPLQILTKIEISDILDAANLGICPSLEAITALLETPHARSLLGAITNNPQWDIKLADYSTVSAQGVQNRELRSGRLNRLKSYATMGECPPDEFLQECQSDPVLAIQIKRMALQKLW